MYNICAILGLCLLGTVAIHNLMASEQQSEVQSDAEYVHSENTKWQDWVYPEAHISVMFGDPRSKGRMYTMRLRFPPHFNVALHRHTQDEYMTILSGTLWVGTKETTATPTLLQPGDSVKFRGGVNHYAWTDGNPVPLVVQIHAVGPRDTILYQPTPS